MTRYRTRARVDSDRFRNVRARERFLYQDQDNYVTQAPDHHPQRATHHHLLITICAFLLTGSVILGALYSGERLAAKGVATNQPEPMLQAALPGAPRDAGCAQASCENDEQTAQIAWRYFQNNHHPATGLVNSVDGVETTTLWDTGSSIAAFLTARDFDFISQRDFDHSVMALLQTLAGIELVDGVAPNILYSTTTGRMVDYNNEETQLGVGVSTIDLARTAYWLNTLQCMHPKYFNPVNRVLDRWDYSKLFKNGQLYGLAHDSLTTEKAASIQQGRFGFEQYAGRIFQTLGHPTDVSANYDNQYRAHTEILGTKIAHDNRDPRNTGVNNFVLTDSYTLDAMELGLRSDNRELLRQIFDVQRERWRRTGIATALTDGHINQPPYYLYNTIFDAGLTFTTTTDTGLRNDELRTVSTRAAFMLATMFPENHYSPVLLSAIESAYDPEKGWFSGVYENGGFNDITTANTNGIILETMLYKKHGTLNNQCRSNWGSEVLPRHPG